MPTLAILTGGYEIWIILAVVLLLFGGRKLPELARSMGSSITQFKKGLKDADSADETAQLGAPKSSESSGSQAGSKEASKERVES